MELINKKSKVIKQHRHYARFSPFIRFANRKYIHFPVSTVELANMRVGDFVHFIDLGNTVCFLVNKDRAGFELHVNSKRDISLRISNTAFIDWFFDKFKLKKGVPITFYVNESTSEYQGQKMFEILTGTPRIDSKALKQKTK